MANKQFDGEFGSYPAEHTAPDEFPPPPPEITPPGGTSAQESEGDGKGSQKDRLRTIIKTLFMPAAALILTTTVIYSSYGIDLINDFSRIDDKAFYEESSFEESGVVSDDDVSGSGHGSHGSGEESDGSHEEESSAEESAAEYYTVVWRAEDGTELGSFSAEAGTTPAFDGEEPYKEPDEQYTYTFAGWSPEITEVTGDAEYTAVFESTLNTYTVSWLGDGGEVLLTETLEYGASPEYSGVRPEKAGDAQYSYEFTGWSPEITEVTGDAEYTAVFESTLNTYTVVWYGAQGEVLQSETLEYGADPVYNGDIPIKPADSEHIYAFTGWSPEVTSVTGDAEYTATFADSLQSYKIKWYNEDGTLLSEEYVKFGNTPSYGGSTPTKASTVAYEYTFSGWSPELTSVTGDAEYTATFSSKRRKYTIRFLNEDGTVLQSTSVYANNTPSYSGSTPTKAMDTQHTYSFSGWSPALSAVTGNADYTAVFSSSARKYTIKWANYDGSILSSSAVAYGTTPSYSGTPQREPGSHYDYTFTGWSPRISKVTGNATYTAQYSETDLFPTLTYLAPSEEEKLIEIMYEDDSVMLVKGYTYAGAGVGTDPHASYDESTNTLTLNGVNCERIYVNCMGSDFKIKVVGTNYVGSLEVSGEYEKGGSLMIEGTGTLNIGSGDESDEMCFYLYGGSGQACLMICRGVTININSAYTALEIYATTMSKPLYYCGTISVNESQIKIEDLEADGYYLQILDSNGEDYVTQLTFGG